MTRICFALVFVALLLLTAPAWSQEDAGAVFVISAPRAVLFSAPDEAQPSTTSLARGRRVQSAGQAQGGFLPVMTRSGAKAWVRVSDVVAETGGSAAAAASDDVAEPQPPASAPAPGPAPRAGRRVKKVSRASERAGSGFGIKRITFDLGASAGSFGGTSYTELQLGLNTYFADWLVWRNAVFGRFPSAGTTLYGLDSGVRGIANLGPLVVFAGPGWRFVNQGGNAPFAEAGLVLRGGGFALGGGVKSVLHSWVQSGSANDNQYFIILSGGGSL